MGIIKKCSPQAGFSIVAALVIIVVLAAVGFIGWLVWDKYSNQSGTSNNTVSDPSEGGKYLVIKEWGVRLKLTDEIKDGKYKVTNDGVYLSTDSIEQIPSCKDGTIVLLQRAPESGNFGDLSVRELLRRPDNPLLHVGDYYYLQSGPPADCANPNSLPTDQVNAQDEDKFTRVRQAFYEAIQTLE